MERHEYDSFDSRLENVFRVAELIPRFKEGLLTFDETAFIADWLRESDANRRMFESMTIRESPKGRIEVIRSFEVNRQRAFQEIVERAGIQIPGVRRFRSRRVAGLLSLILVIGLGIYMCYRQVSSRPTVLPVVSLSPSKILPGRSTATLLLSNGQTVGLDSAHEGHISQQPGDVTLTNGNGQLSYISNGNASGEILYNTIVTNRGGQYKLILSDGTKVWLDASSSLHYPTTFSGKTREVTLAGQAYFEVAENKSQPFEVIVGGEKVRVLGTRFNIMAYPDEKSIETTLLQGAVAVSSGNADRTLHPGEQARLSGDGSLSVASVDADDYVAWKNGLIRLHHADVAMVMRQISRWYDVDVRYDLRGKVLPSWTLAGTIPRNTLTLEQVFKILWINGINCRLQSDAGSKMTVVVSL